MSQATCLVACFAVTLGCGTLYTYSAYSPQLSDRLNLSAGTISAIGMVGNFSMSLSGPLAGYIVDTFGPLYPVLVSILATGTGYAVLYTAFVNAYSNVPLLTLALFLLGIGATFAFSSTVKCAAVNFPRIRGTATAVTMSGYGLSAFAISFIARVTSHTTSGIEGAKHMLATLGIVPTVLLMVFGPIVVRSRPPKQIRSVTEEYNLDQPPTDILADRVNNRMQIAGESYGFKLLRHPMFWIYFFILGILAGLGQAYIYTCGYMAKALVASVLDTTKVLDQEVVASVQAHQVALLSLANCCGRIISGTVSDAFKNRFKLSRTYTLLIPILLCLGAMMLSQRTEDVDNLWIPTTLTGLFYGAVFGAYPGIISDEFGLRKLSSNWGLVALAPIPFSSWLAVRIGEIYDAHSAYPGMCIGSQCFQSAYTLHVILAMVTLVLFVAALKFQKTTAAKV